MKNPFIIQYDDKNMLKDTIINQKNEKTQLLSKSYVERERTAEAQKHIENDLIKVVTGPRRAGKSVFSLLLLKEKPFVYLNFDEESLIKVKDHNEILKEIISVYGETKFLLFDEIQNIADWELFANSLHRQGYNLLLTGSNARLLSKELATSLTGRHVPIEILPFSFREFLKAKQFNYSGDELKVLEIKGKLLNYLGIFMINGGFPELVVKDLDPKGYLDTLLDSLLFKDIVKRYHLRFPQKIYDLLLYLINNPCSEISYQRLSRTLGFNSAMTLEKYLGYLEEAYLVFTLGRFSFKTGERLRSPKKIFVVDNGYVAAKAVSFSPNYGKLMENLVFTELVKKGSKPNRDLFYYKTRNQKEVDFALKEGVKITKLIQVCHDYSNVDTQQREVKSLVEASGELNCDDLTIITWDQAGEETFKGKKIILMPLWQWLI